MRTVTSCSEGALARACGGRRGGTQPTSLYTASRAGACRWWRAYAGVARTRVSRAARAPTRRAAAIAAARPPVFRAAPPAAAGRRSLEHRAQRFCIPRGVACGRYRRRYRAAGRKNRPSAPTAVVSVLPTSTTSGQDAALSAAGACRFQRRWRGEPPLRELERAPHTACPASRARRRPLRRPPRPPCVACGACCCGQFSPRARAPSARAFDAASPAPGAACNAHPAAADSTRATSLTPLPHRHPAPPSHPRAAMRLAPRCPCWTPRATPRWSSRTRRSRPT